MSRIEFTEEMNEVTGLGGFYERCVRAAICAGAKWLIAHQWDMDMEKMQRAIFDTELHRDDGVVTRLGDELRTAQMGFVMHHLRKIAELGWDEYQRRMCEKLKVYG